LKQLQAPQRFLCLYVRDKLETELAMSHALSSTIIFLNTHFQNLRSIIAKDKTKCINAKDKSAYLDKAQNIFILFLMKMLFYGLAIHWEIVRFPP
jgi:hypothetical protein